MITYKGAVALKDRITPHNNIKKSMNFWIIDFFYLSRSQSFRFLLCCLTAARLFLHEPNKGTPSFPERHRACAS